MRVTSGILIIGASLLLPLPVRAERVEQLNPRGYVNDFAGVLGPETEAELTALCAEVDRKTRAQIAVVTIRSLEGLPVEDFGHRLATRWGVGYKGDNRGVLILLAVSDRKYRIEVGYGLESLLPDGKVGGFGREMVPQLRQGDYGGALLSLTRRLADVIAQDRGVTLAHRPGVATPRARTRPPAQRPPRTEPDPLTKLLTWILWVTVLLLGWSLVAAVWATFKATLDWLSDGDTWAAFWWLAWKACWPSGSGNGGGWGGGWGGGGGGFDFGGFGGGDFGGGGASGSW